MELKDILTIAVASIIVLVIAHLAVFWVVRTMYPPSQVQVQPQPQPQPQPQVFTQPVVEQQQHVVIPTYEAPIPVEAPRKEEPARGPPPPEATSIHGASGLDTTNA